MASASLSFETTFLNVRWRNLDRNCKGRFGILDLCYGSCLFFTVLVILIRYYCLHIPMHEHDSIFSGLRLPQEVTDWENLFVILNGEIVRGHHVT